jgi:hypothetical protein
MTRGLIRRGAGKSYAAELKNRGAIVNGFIFAEFGDGP